MQPIIQRPETQMDARLKAALAGQYSFSIKNLFDEAWAKTKGFKGIYWSAFGVTVLIALVLLLSSALVTSVVGINTGGIVGDKLHLVTPLEQILQIPLPMFVTLVTLLLASLIVVLPLVAGLWMISMTHIAGRPVRFKMLFQHYHKPMRYWLANLWATIIIEIANLLGEPAGKYLADVAGPGFAGSALFWLCIALSVVVQVYILVSYFFMFPLLADKKLGAWQALEVSRKAVGQHWFKVFGVILMLLLVSVFIPVFVIGLLVGAIHKAMLVFLVLFIWLLPFYSLCTAALYREIFGITSTEQTL